MILILDYIIILAAGIAIGYIIGTYSARHAATKTIQHEIDIEALKRQADGIYRKGDAITEIEPVRDGILAIRTLIVVE